MIKKRLSEEDIPEGYVSHRELIDILKRRKIDSYDSSIRAITIILTVGMVILGLFSWSSYEKMSKAQDDIREIRDNIGTEVRKSMNDALSSVRKTVDGQISSLNSEREFLRSDLHETGTSLRDEVRYRMERIESDYRQFTGRPLAKPDLVLLHNGQPVQDGGSYGGILSSGVELDFHEFSLKNVGDAPATIRSVSYYFRDQMKFPSNIIVLEEPEEQESTDPQYPCLFVSTVGRVQTIAADANINYFTPIWVRADNKSINPPVPVRIIVYYNGETLSRTFNLNHTLLPKGK